MAKKRRPTTAQLTRRIQAARSNSVDAFVKTIVTGRDPNEIEASDQLSAWGFDDRNIDQLADKINEAHWHKVRVKYAEIERCKTIQDVIDLVAQKVNAQIRALERSNR
jgi:hypothetical protein